MLKKHTLFIILILLNLLKATHCFAIPYIKYTSIEHTTDIPSPIYKTSFNCAKAGTQIEHRICHSQELANEDIELSTLYYQLVKKQSPAFINQQKIWLKDREYCSYSNDIEQCLLKKYQDRISQLKDLQTMVPSKTRVVEQLETSNHPVLPILKKHNISLYDVTYSKNGTCPTFYVTLKSTPLNSEGDEYSKKIYDELLNANSSFPYAIVDKARNFKVNVGFIDKAKMHSVVRPADISSPSSCLDGSSSPDTEQFTVIAQMKKRILDSPFKADLRQKDGKKVTAYLYAVDEKTVPYDYNGCTTGIKLRAKVKTGHYYVYLYDELTDYFYPNRTPVFNDIKPAIMGIEGSYFFAIPAEKENESDKLVISQRDNCQKSFYESYSLWQDQISLQKLNSFHNYSALQFYLQGQIGKAPPHS